MQRQSGGWTLTQKKSVRELVGAGAPAPPRGGATPAPLWAPLPPSPEGVDARADRGEDGLLVVRADTAAERAVAAARMLARTSRSALRYGVLVLVIAGLVAARGRPAQRGVFALTLIGVYGAVLFALTFQVGYVSRRHALPPLVPLFGYAALGAAALGAWLAKPLRRGGRSAAALAAGLVGVVAIGEIATQREPRRHEESAARAAAEWLRANGSPGAALSADRMRLGYYAGMPYIAFPRVDDASLRAQIDWQLDRGGVRYVLLDEPGDIENLRRVAGDRLKPLHRAVAGGREAWVFERVDSVQP
jgi:hypothetical protein